MSPTKKSRLESELSTTLEQPVRLYALFLEWVRNRLRQKGNEEKMSHVDDLHFLFVVHVVDGETALVDEVVQCRVFLDQQLVWNNNPARSVSIVVNEFDNLMNHLLNCSLVLSKIFNEYMSRSYPRQVVRTHLPAFVKQYKLLSVRGDDSLKTGG